MRQRACRISTAGPRRLSFESLEARQLLAVFTVTNLNDAPVTAPGQAPGTLRQAVFDANNQAGADTIRFQSGLGGAIDLTVAADAAVGPSALLISSPITVEGNAAGITIGRDSAAAEMRLFRVTSTGSFRLDSISLIAGVARGPNDGEGHGGAILNEGTLEIIASTLYDNRAIGGDAAAGIYGERGLGGAIYNDGGTVLLENATLSGSIAQSGGGPTVLSSLGGAIYSRNGNLSIYNSTITNSTASTGRGVYVLGIEGTATVEIYSSIITQADVTTQARDLVVAEDTGGVAMLSGANNLIRTHNVYPEITIPDPTDPLLGALADNGGPTPTHALSNQSPAINQGSNPRSLATDQRGPSHMRVIGGEADIGAFEVQTVIGPALPGDYNQDDVVDAADYVIWRKTLGSQVTPYSGADGSGNGAVDPDDHNVWRDNFGNESAPASSSADATVATSEFAAFAPITLRSARSIAFDLLASSQRKPAKFNSHRSNSLTYFAARDAGLLVALAERDNEPAVDWAANGGDSRPGDSDSLSRTDMPFDEWHQCLHAIASFAAPV